ncbi:transcription antitermination factor NusB, partial [Petrachloros mirabilis]
MPMPRNRRLASLPQSARSVALSVLVESVTSEEGVDVLLDRAGSSSALDSRDRSLAMELAYGVLRRQGTIDWRLGFVLDKPVHRLPILVQMLLRVGAYQILYLERIPQSAAVNESVNLAKAYSRVMGRDWSGFVNAVLRSLIRESAPPWPSEPPKALAVRCSVPEWLSRRWFERLGLEKAEQACEQTCGIPPLTVRVNRLKTTREDFLARLHQAGIAAQTTAVSPVGIVIQDSGPVPDLPGFVEGLFYVEDEAAQLIPLVLSPRPGDVILDACAAPGGKATHLAELTGDQGAVYAIDRKGPRLDLLRNNSVRLGIKCIIPLVGDVRHPS